MKLLFGVLAAVLLAVVGFVAYGTYAATKLPGRTYTPPAEPMAARMDDCKPTEIRCVRQLVAEYYPEATYTGAGDIGDVDTVGDLTHLFQNAERVAPCDYLEWDWGFHGYSPDSANVPDDAYAIRVEGPRENCVEPMPEYYEK